MAAVVLPEGSKFDEQRFQAFLAEQADLGAKQWPAFVRVSTTLPRTETFKILKRLLSAEGVDCADPVYPVKRHDRDRMAREGDDLDRLA